MSERRTFGTLTEQMVEHAWRSWVAMRDTYRTAVDNLRIQGKRNSEKPLSTLIASFDEVRRATLESLEKAASEMKDREVGELEEPLRSTLVRLRELKKEKL